MSIGSVSGIHDFIRVTCPNPSTIDLSFDHEPKKKKRKREREREKAAEKECSNVQKRKTKDDSDTGNRTPSCRVRDGDVNHYTISDVVEIFWHL